MNSKNVCVFLVYYFSEFDFLMIKFFSILVYEYFFYWEWF